MAHRSLPYLRLLVIALFTFNLLNPVMAGSVENTLSKWGVKSKDSNSIPINSASRLQPMTRKYAYWLAIKYIPDFFDDKTTKDYVTKELKDTRHYYYRLGGVGSNKPWLTESEIRDRNPDLAAPEFMGRYRQTIRQFSSGLSDRVRLTINLGQATYNAAKGLTVFNTGGGKTNFAGQSYIKDPNDYSYLLRYFGREETDRFADRLSGRMLGEGANVKDGSVQPRLAPGTRIPAIMRSVPNYVMLYLALDRDLTIDGIPMSQREAEKFLNKYQRATGTMAAFAEVDVVVKGAIRLPAKGGASAIGKHYVTLIADVKEKGRNSYGPDILGLRLGMSEKKARSVMQRQRFSSRASTDDPRPFHDATLQWTRDDTHGIALYYLYSGGEKRLAAVSRRLYFDNKNTRIDQVRDGLRKKYGKESQASASGTLLWVGKGKSGTRSCKRLEKKLAERTDWSRKWKAPRVRGSQSMSTGSAQSVSQACMSKYGFKPGMMPGAGTFDISKMMGLQQCMSQQAGKMIPGSSGRKQRATMMIAKEGAPQDYQKFASCGPVIIASQHNDASGKLTDVSLVLFDPAWLAELPAYLFKQSGSTGDIQF